LTGALRSALEEESTEPGDSGELVIERGWLPEGIALGPETVLRHRNFPEASWPRLGLMTSDDGVYYDPERQLIWSPDPDGRGFVGRNATESDDLAAFRVAEDRDFAATAPVRTEPEGFLIEDPESDVAEVVIDQVPPPEDGHEQVIMWTDMAGNETVVKVDRVAVVPTPGQRAANEAEVMVIPASPSASATEASTLVVSLPKTGGVKSFKLIEKAVKPNGKPAKVIVSGEHPSRRKGPK
jgi:hypothetical protein